MTNNNTNQPNQQPHSNPTTPKGNLLRRVTSTNNNIKNHQQSNLNTPFRSPVTSNADPKNSQSDKPSWTITPIGLAGVKIAYLGIGDPLFKILGTTLDTSLVDSNTLVEMLHTDEDLLQHLVERLETAWHTYEFKGATMMHPARTNIQKAFNEGIFPIAEAEVLDSDTNDSGKPKQDQPITAQNLSQFETLRAVDASFVLNVLGRVRGGVLLEGTPIALEAGFLNQSYISDDPRIIDLALATGAIEEIW